jgi:hypothetical protein
VGKARDSSNQEGNKGKGEEEMSETFAPSFDVSLLAGAGHGDDEQMGSLLSQPKTCQREGNGTERSGEENENAEKKNGQEMGYFLLSKS